MFIRFDLHSDGVKKVALGWCSFRRASLFTGRGLLSLEGKELQDSKMMKIERRS